MSDHISFEKESPVIKPRRPRLYFDFWWDMALLGKFEDSKEWTVNLWGTKGYLKVRELGEYFLFRCQVEEDKDGLATLGHASMQGLVLILKQCGARKTLKSLNFNDVYLWVQLRGYSLWV